MARVMAFFESIRTSLAEIRSHKLRSLLTLAGIILGTTSLVVMVSVIGGAARSVQKGLSDLGFDGVMFVTEQPPSDRLERKKQGYSKGLRTADLATIEDGRSGLEAAAPMASVTEIVRLNGRPYRVTLEGITPAYGRIRNRGASEGRYLVDHDVETTAPVAVIGKELREEAFGTQEVLGREATIRGVRFQIVGVLRSLGTDQVNDDEMRLDNS